MLSAVISVRSTNFDGNIIRQRNSRPEEDLQNQMEGNDEANTSLAFNEPLNLVEEHDQSTIEGNSSKTIDGASVVLDSGIEGDGAELNFDVDDEI